MNAGTQWVDAKGRIVRVEDFVRCSGGVWLVAWCTPRSSGWTAHAKAVSPGDPEHVVRASVAALARDERVRTYSRKAEALRSAVKLFGWAASIAPTKEARRVVALHRAGVTNESELARRARVSYSFVIRVLDLPARLFREVAA